MERALVFWLDGPPVCCKGVFDAVANLWKGDVYYVITRRIDDNRARIITNDCDGDSLKTSRAIYVVLSEMNNPQEYGMKFLEEHYDDIHVFNGYMSNSSVYLNKLLKMNKKSNTLIWAERPCPQVLKRPRLYKLAYCSIHKLRHRMYACKLRNKIDALLPLGMKGVESYCSNGWKKRNVYPFLYLPTMNESIAPSECPADANMVRFVYLGRFSSGWKGTDILIEACKKLQGKNYKLTLVGGYGDYKDQTLEYIDQNPNLEFGGTWPIDEACDRLSKYDVCIVPSRFEGWNVTVNEALMAGIGCIVTDETVSDELVTSSGAGLVVKAGDPQALADSMDEVLRNPQMINVWKKAAFGFRPYMTAQVCAQYFISVLDYLFNNRSNRPIPPWYTGKE